MHLLLITPLCIYFTIVCGSNIVKIKYSQNNGPLVTIPLGDIEGSILKSRLGKNIYSFRGIRFAKPPLGPLRFQPPEPMEPWMGVYNATVDGPECPQPTNDISVISEDCLILNVYSTKLPMETEVPKKPVIVYFYPGAWYLGSSRSVVAGPQYLMDKDIVLVTVNYRLGSLGMISTGDEYAPGNIAFKDQVLALKWVHNYINRFGGDPDLVTISGDSAGARSVTLHIVSPMSKGLFHRVIALSGSSVANWKIYSDQKHLAKKQADILGCPSNNSMKILSCLRTKSYLEFTSVADFKEYGQDPDLIWTPVIEPDFGQERFLIEDPTVTLLKGNYTKVPIMAGITFLEFISDAYNIIGNETLLKEMNDDFKRIAPIAFLYERDTARSKEISKELRKFYFNDSVIDKSQVNRLGQLYSDGVIGFGVHRFVQLIAKNNACPIYYYRFSYRGMYSNFYLPGSNNGTPIGPVHTDDLIYLFYNSKSFPLFNENDPSTKIVERMTTLWYNFAKTGNPTPDKNPVLERQIWEPLTPENQKFMDIKCHLDMKENMFQDRYALWDRLFPLPDITNIN